MTGPDAGGPDAATLDRLRVEVAQACRVLATEGLVSDILGHVSVRVGPDRMLIRSRSPRDPGLLFSRPYDVVLSDFDGNPAEELGDRQLPQELAIHGEVLRARPDDGAVVHAHPPDVVLCSIAGLELQPIVGAFSIPAMRLAERGIPVFDYYGLVKTRARGEQMVATMDGRQVVLLRGHGLTTAGPTIAGAVITALQVNRMAKMTAAVAGTGRTAALVPEADRAELPDLGSGFNEGLVWQYHLAHLDHLGLAI